LNHKIVTHLKDGSLIKGFASEIVPTRPDFEVVTPDQVRKKIEFKDLKAIFFVKDFKGNPFCQESKSFSPNSPAWGVEARVELWDHEVVIGKILLFPEDKDWFYLYPADTRSNNVRILLMRDCIRDLRMGEEELAELRNAIGPYYYA